ncbi:MAG: hypothetical protein JWO05_1248 [Gemmatimonadetes bacterium]|nr:hypothetical protein [Gemmatimonadota bacterium]
MRRVLSFLVVLIAGTITAAPLSAQIIQPARRMFDPGIWVSFGVGLLNVQAIDDPATSSTWAFAAGSTQYRATLEKALGGGTSIGVTGGIARAGMTYASASLACLNGCDADADVTQLFATFRAGGTRGFHQVLELSAGTTLFSNFKQRSSGAKLAPTQAVNDFSFAFGYGFGYALSQTTQVSVVQDIGTMLHRHSGSNASNNSTPRFSGTRIGVRFGLGERR